VKRLPTAILVLLLACGSFPAFAGPGGTRRTWELAPFSWIKRIPAEKGAPPNDHPRLVGSAGLARALATIELVSGSTVEPLFEPDEAVALGKALAEAFALAEPGEDLELLSTAQRGPGLFGQSPSVTARVFLTAGRLNLIIHEARLNFAEQYYFEFKLPKVECGSRTLPSAVVLKAAQGALRRPDWVVLPLEIGPLDTAARPALPASIEERLRSLKRLREQDLITDGEYSERRQELLKGL
jgi:hypothetical protein